MLLVRDKNWFWLKNLVYISIIFANTQCKGLSLRDSVLKGSIRVAIRALKRFYNIEASVIRIGFRDTRCYVNTAAIKGRLYKLV